MENAAMIGNSLILLGISIIFTGFLIIALGSILKTRSREEWNGNNSSRSFPEYNTEKNAREKLHPPEIKSGGVIMLGPIPLVFGSDAKSAKSAIILAIILMALALFMTRGSLL